jgi:hypothetical protein
VLFFSAPSFSYYKKSRKKDENSKNLWKKIVFVISEKKKIFTSVVDVAFILWLLSWL